MFARCVTFRLKSKAHADYTRALEIDVVPLLRRQKGFKNEITLSNAGSDEVVAISLWDNQANADEYDTRAYPEILRLIAKIIDGTPRVQTFETVTSTLHSLVAP